MLNGVQGTVILRFKVNTDGKAENPEILKGLDPECDKEAIHLVNSLPEWVPGENGGKKVTVYYTLPIRFRIEGSGMQENLNKVLIVDGKIMPGSYDFRKAFGKDIISMTVLNPDSREIINDLVKKYGQKASSGVILITTNKNNHVAVSDSINELTKSKYKIYKASSLDKMPQFPGGLNKLDNFISSNLKLIPEEKSEKLRTVIVQFIIDGNGKVIQPLIIQGVNPVLNAEAIRVVKIIPDWIPGEVNGIKVASYYFLPITY
jgi:TonB family protein